MPSKNAIKKYVAGGYYHLYNRGVNRGIVFGDDQDYRVFLSLLKLYLSPPVGTSFGLPEKPHKDLSNSIELFDYCLMPNHFHIGLRQLNDTGIADFGRCVFTNYVMYFNKKYSRIGSLFQDTYKAVLMESDEQLRWLSRYIAHNPVGLVDSLSSYQYSSYRHNLSPVGRPIWLKSDLILDLFDSTAAYRDFVEGGIGSLPPEGDSLGQGYSLAGVGGNIKV